jgi:glycosyltransferase involved in cell wall biosynthesis
VPSNDILRRPQRDPSADPRVSVVIPAHNEAANLPHVLSLLPRDVEVILVDGRSTDGTVAVTQALRPDATIIQQDRRGKGNALACGFAAATGDIVVALEADGSADPREIPRFVDALVRGADVAKGTRFAKGGKSSDSTVLRTFGNRCLSALATLLFGTRCTDLTYSYTALWARCLP